MGEFETGAFFFLPFSIWWIPGGFIWFYEKISKWWLRKWWLFSQGKTNIIAMEISRMFPGKNTIFKRCCNSIAMFKLKGPFFNWGLRPGGMVQVKGLKGDAVGDAQFIESVWQTSSLRFFTSRIQARRFFFLQKLRSTCHDLELLKVTFDFPPLSGWNLRLLDPRLRPCVWMVRRASGRPRILWADVTPKTE